ncbi:MAG: Crp/Fnr family transcriptional regulator, partial [Candidatus Dadabacteria bacterium]
SAACEEIELALKKLPLFAALREQDLKTLASEAKIRILKGGEVLYFEGEEGIDCFLVLDGLLLMVKSSDCGKELIVDFVSPGDILGLTMVYPSAQSGVTVRAQKLSRIICIPSPLLNPFLESNPQLYRELLLALSERLRRSHNFSRSLAHDRAQVRVASALVALANRMVDCNNGEFPVVSLSRQELADLTGITVETAIRVTKAMERDGLLDLKRPYHIGLKSIEALRKISEERV